MLVRLGRSSGIGTKHHWAGWLISCPESKEERTPVEGLRNSGRRRVCGVARHACCILPASQLMTGWHLATCSAHYCFSSLRPRAKSALCQFGQTEHSDGNELTLSLGRLRILLAQVKSGYGQRSTRLPVENNRLWAR